MLCTSFAALVLAASALAVAGCGGSSKTESTATSAASTTPSSTTTAQSTAPTTTTSQVIKIQKGKPLSHTVWITKGDEICAIANLRRHATTAKTEEQVARLAPQISGYDHIEAVELSKLVPPSNMAGDWKLIIANVQKISEFAAQLGEYAQTHRYNAAAPILASAVGVEERLGSIAKRDGFKQCASS